MDIRWHYMDYKNKEPIKYTKLPRLPYFNQQLMSRDQEFRSSILGPAPFILYINDIPDVAICNIAVYFDNTCSDHLNQRPEDSNTLHAFLIRIFSSQLKPYKGCISVAKVTWYEITNHKKSIFYLTKEHAFRTCFFKMLTYVLCIKFSLYLS